MGKPLKYRGFSLQSMRAIMLAHIETYKVDMYSHVDSHTHSKAKNKTKQTKIILKEKTNKKNIGVHTSVFLVCHNWNKWAILPQHQHPNINAMLRV